MTTKMSRAKHVIFIHNHSDGQLPQRRLKAKFSQYRINLRFAIEVKA